MKEQTQATGGAKRRKYDATFKGEVLQMVNNGRPVSEVARSLGIGENLIYRWRSKAGSGEQQQAVTATAGSTTAVEDTLALQRRIQQLEQERDILKKALGIFSRQT